MSDTMPSLTSRPRSWIRPNFVWNDKAGSLCETYGCKRQAGIAAWDLLPGPKRFLLRGVHRSMTSRLGCFTATGPGSLCEDERQAWLLVPYGPGSRVSIRLIGSRRP